MLFAKISFTTLRYLVNIKFLSSFIIYTIVTYTRILSVIRVQ